MKPKIKLIINNLCLGDTTFAKAISALPFSYNWQINSNNINTTDSTLKIRLPFAGKYKINVSINTFACSAADSLDFTIIEKPKAAFSYTRLKVNYIGHPYHFNDESSNANTWLWQFGKSGSSDIQNPNYVFKDTGQTKIQLIVSNGEKCFDTLETIIPIFDRIQFFFPNAFSPNGNNINDGFGLNPNQYYLVKTYHLEIYNRWGELLFKTEDMKEQWGGSQQGVYLFKVLITDIYGEEREVSGAVEVLR